MEGDTLPVSAFVKDVDGTVPLGTAAYEKRGIAVDVPCWLAGKLHPVQPVLLCLPPRGHPSLRNEEGGQERPGGMKMSPDQAGSAGSTVRHDRVALDCMGCGLCGHVCPVKGTALVMQPLESQRAQQASSDYWQKVAES